MSKRKPARAQPTRQAQNALTDILIESHLKALAEKRIGGSVTFTGIGFQVLYAVDLILRNLHDVHTGCTITLEGLEDIDMTTAVGTELIQVKTSKNTIDAGKFWELNVLQNFWEVNKVTKGTKFKLIHNTKFASGNMVSIGSTSISEAALNFWTAKISSLGVPVSQSDVADFLSRICVEDFSEAELLADIRKQLFAKFEVNIGTELQFLKALFFNVFEWSKRRQTLSPTELKHLMQSVKDSFSRFPANPAIQNNWIVPVAFEISQHQTVSGYYDGKAARPEDIARGLPVQRPEWEVEIGARLKEYDVIVIKSSSGQGKSTLAWQTCFSAVKDGCTIYHLRSCTSHNEASAIADFIKSRLVIGEQPIVIIDGLQRSVAVWTEFAEQIREHPVKLMITTREEDWVRYGGDESKVSIKTIDIRLSVHEAAVIFQELKKNNKLHHSITNWQPAWEKVKDKGLLIEYVFLLTQGQMIDERIAHQIQRLSKEQDGSAKLEVLRLVATADVLNIRLRNNSLTRYIQGKLRAVDKNEVYRQLEKEYYLKFEGKYVEGLHPVRSQHLVNVLHSHCAIEESLLAVLEVVDEDYIYDYFISAPFLSSDKEFYSTAATVTAQKPLAEIVYAIDGLMHFEPYRYWKENQEVFDRVFTRGGLELFVYDAIPYNRRNTIVGLSQSVGSELNSDLQYLSSQLSLLTTYNSEHSILFRFVKDLQKAIPKGEIENYEGIAFLFKWFKRVGVAFPKIVEIDEAKLLSGLETQSISESSEIFHFYSILDPDRYKVFASKHHNTIVGWIKKRTNTLSIFEEGDNIKIEYLLDENADKANELSMYRINIIHAFFPFYKSYCTSAIVIPFPNEEVYKAVLQNAHKHIPAENLFDDFDVHINQIWAKTILGQYAASSSYDWQNQHLHLREKALDIAKKITWLFETHLEKKQAKIKSQANSVASLANEVLCLEKVLRKYPSGSRKYFESAAFTKEQVAFSKWLSSFRNFLNQMGGLVVPKKDHDRHLPVVNLESAVHHLSAMQDAFAKIAEGSHAYFATSDLGKDESTWYPRLLETVRYYVEQAKNGFAKNVVVAAKSVAAWVDAERKREIGELQEVVQAAGVELHCVFHMPTRIRQEEHLKYVTIGVWGVDIQNDLWELSVSLKDLTMTKIDFFALVFVDDDRKVTGAIRFNRDYFERVKKAIDFNEFEEGATFVPIPIFPNEEILNELDGISLRTVPNNQKLEAYFKMMISVWKLSEYRQRLNRFVPVELSWLQEIEEEQGKIISRKIHSVYGNQDFGILPDRATVERFLKEESPFGTDQIVQFMIEASLNVPFRLT